MQIYWHALALIIIHWSLSLFWLAERIQWTFEISACDVITADYTDETIIWLGFCDIQNNQELGKVISLSRLITPTSTLIILDITKTSSSNCFLLSPYRHVRHWQNMSLSRFHFHWPFNSTNFLMGPPTYFLARTCCESSKLPLSQPHSHGPL